MIRIGVIGYSSFISPDIYKLAEEVGKEIAKSGAVLLTGGRNGVMEAASKGAKSANGLVVGILPGDDTKVANEFVDIPITTGLGFDYRSLVLVHSSDAIIMISGGNGTLGELSTAYLNRRPVIILQTSGGWAGRICDVAYEGKYLDERKNTALDFAYTAKDAVKIAIKRINQKEK